MLETATVPPHTMEFDPTTHPHRRYNPLSNEHVLVSPHRTKRPWQGQTEPPQTQTLPQYDPQCYLCPGNKRSNGDVNETYEHTYVFPNDFPALLGPPAPLPPPAPHPLLSTQPVQGRCDVMIFHPRHDLTLARLSIPDIERVIEEWTSVYEQRGREKGINYVQIFENKGAMMGCSNPHPHGQVWSLSTVPQIPARELTSLREYANGTHPSSSPADTTSGAPKGPGGKPCLLCEYAHFEVHGAAPENSRVVAKNNTWVALVPFWAVWPFEILLLPHSRHISSLLDLTPLEHRELAEMLSTVSVKYDNLFLTSFAYSMGLHQRPVPRTCHSGMNGAAGTNGVHAHLNGNGNGHVPNEDEDDVAHMHFHFSPPLLRSASVRKFLVGFELMSEPQRDLTAEQAAARLRDCSETHFLAGQSL
ncbi:Galactose-1-phosphate uridylyltransferase [Ceratobasidium theobromae]|uniref:Galactose-1-phosphate uridylyltransferase n=1 Tax=Ceratobasidium theobromae TaxID=1582974 RepID=A0A5N5QVG6_9AGAM|nr:Galactose-1-phosphate uridylyltransferase [Ceratobasidium theobromae]